MPDFRRKGVKNDPRSSHIGPDFKESQIRATGVKTMEGPYPRPKLVQKGSQMDPKTPSFQGVILQANRPKNGVKKGSKSAKKGVQNCHFPRGLVRKPQILVEIPILKLPEVIDLGWGGPKSVILGCFYPLFPYLAFLVKKGVKNTIFGPFLNGFGLEFMILS